VRKLKRIASVTLTAWLVWFAFLPAHARMTLATDGGGQVLHFPYYTVNNGFDTYVSVVNAAQVSKAVRVRFLESKNGRITFEFNVFLGAQDTWTGAVTRAPSGDGAVLKTSDSSCTFPKLAPAGDRFDTLAFVERVDGKLIDDSLLRTQHGFIEVIEMGRIEDVALTKAVNAVQGVPFDCNLVTSIYTTPSASSPTGVRAEFANALLTPTGKLSGTATLINVATGVDFSYDAIALDGVYTSPQHSAPRAYAALGASDRSSIPSLKDAARDVALIDAGKVFLLDFENGEDAVSALYQRVSLTNNFTVEVSIGAGTDFVMTMPTRRFYMDEGSAQKVRAPFSVPYGLAGAPEATIWEQYDRSQRTSVNDGLQFCTPPPTPATGSDCTVSVYTVFNSNILISGNRKSFKPPVGMNGMITVSFVAEPRNTQIVGTPTFTQDLNAYRKIKTIGATNRMDDVSCKSVSLYGFPVFGFSVEQYVNGNLNGVVSNYGGLFQHKYERKIECEQ
jgi:hypothetical protein